MYNVLMYILLFFYWSGGIARGLESLRNNPNGPASTITNEYYHRRLQMKNHERREQ